MAQSAKAYFEKLFADAGIDPNTATAVISAISHEKVSPQLDSLVKTATEDYNAQLGRVRAMEAKVREYDEQWYPKANAEYLKMQAELAQSQARLQALVGAGNQPSNNPDGTPPPALDPNRFLTKDDFVKAIQEQGGRYANVIKTTNSITAKHVAKFGEAPDFEAIEKISTEENLPLAAAYEKWISPRVKDQDTANRAEWEKKRTAEIEADIRTRLGVPADPVPSESSPFFARPDKGQSAPAGLSDMELLKVWNDAGKA